MNGVGCHGVWTGGPGATAVGVVFTATSGSTIISFPACFCGLESAFAFDFGPDFEEEEEEEEDASQRPAAATQLVPQNASVDPLLPIRQHPNLMTMTLLCFRKQKRGCELTHQYP